MIARIAAVVLGLLATVAGLLILGLAAAWWQLNASLPALDGAIAVPGFRGSISLERDATGVVTITGDDRLDVARATGFAHAQDRFFQMDLLRRSAAGELAELFGDAALPFDRQLRPEQLRRVAVRVLADEPPATRALLAAYSEGVNAGLAELGSRPFEYWLLRTQPQAWDAQDSVLVLLAMFLDLTDRAAVKELSEAYLTAVLGEGRAAFMAPEGGPWDAPMVGWKRELPSIPSSWPESEAGVSGTITAPPVLGSNNWAVSGGASAHGGAIVADDMHLGLRLPNIWYRMRLVISGDAPVDISGVTLPGVPSIVAGSNGHIAWAFTNSYGDWADIIRLEDEDVSLVGATLKSSSGASEEFAFETSAHGPVTRDPLLGPIAVHWLAREPGGVNLNLILLEQAQTVEEAMTVANRAGVPPQNIMIADATGQIGWTIAGMIPDRPRSTAKRPMRWNELTGWRGWVAVEKYPRVIGKPVDRLWTANARVVDGWMLDAIGDGGYALGARATQIRDQLERATDVTEADMLALQLDDRALYLSDWRSLLLDTLKSIDTAAIDDAPTRDKMTQAIQSVEDGATHAATDDAGYLLVRRFHDAVRDSLYSSLVAPVFEQYPEAPVQRSRQFEHAVIAMLIAQPPHLVPSEYEDWRAFLQATAQGVVTQHNGETWGTANAVNIAHPVAAFLPAWMGRHLIAPVQPQPGDRDMPRVAGPAFGASQRFVVSPGKEEQGIFHMPGGQSGHPLSPYFLAGHDAWLAGEPTPFLPGDAQHTLTLRPTHSD